MGIFRKSPRDKFHEERSSEHLKVLGMSEVFGRGFFIPSLVSQHLYPDWEAGEAKFYLLKDGNMSVWMTSGFDFNVYQGSVERWTWGHQGLAKKSRYLFSSGWCCALIDVDEGDPALWLKVHVGRASKSEPAPLKPEKRKVSKKSATPASKAKRPQGTTKK